MLTDGHAPETVMAGAFGLGAVAAAAGAGAHRRRLARAARRRRARRSSSASSRPPLAYLLFARGLRRLSAAETATLTLAEPLTAALLGVIVLSERMSAPAALGAALILGGLLVLAAPDVRRRPATVPA